MNKRGMSAVILTIIMIGLVFVTTTIVWGVVSNILNSQADSASSSSIGIDLDIEKYEMTGNGLQVIIERGVGKGDLSGIVFVTESNGEITTTELPATLEELGSTTFILPGVYAADSISIAPIIKTSSGKEVTQQIVEKKEIEVQEIPGDLLNMPGLVSWLRFNGDATDEIGTNDGTIVDTDCTAAGKFGQACEFSGGRIYIDYGNNLDVSTNPQTYVLWAKWDGGVDAMVLTQGLATTSRIYLGAAKNKWDIGIQTSVWGSGEAITPADTNWHHLALALDGSSAKLYVDGALSFQKSYTPFTTNTALIVGGYTSNFNWDGKIDELIIFNRALAASEIQELYNLNLG